MRNVFDENFKCFSPIHLLFLSQKFQMCFSPIDLLFLSQKWFDCLETKSKRIDWTLGLKWDHKVWPCIFKVKYGICYVSAKKWSDCHETKSKHIIQNIGINWNHRVWLWPWPWPWLFKPKYGICYISAKHGLIATKRKANISSELQASNVTITLKSV